MHRQLVRPVQRRQHGNVDHATSLALKTWTSPDGAPTRLGDDMLDWHGEIGDGAHGFLDVSVPEDCFADFHTFVEERLVGFFNVVGTHFGNRLNKWDSID